MMLRKAGGRRTLILTALLISAAALGVYGYAGYGSPAHPDAIIVKEVHVTGGKLLLNGTTTGSGTGYSGYNLAQDGGHLYVRLRYSLLARSGDFDIAASLPDANISHVYLQGEDGRSEKLIWSEPAPLAAP
ncbi:hypothetical protein SK3146_05040 [Paenibacillus konkukensis]|uniref:Uncharacterized protein n=1 Tax=Paenibacillus konkukensis TaxID=2020716 RepID=A0ABY4RVP7_9BACL|nr:hypothetical protein [Paenibacillus konkukensis]UQZ85751.1 hypothetical protein SK3146_05040 [Paenibacillus konkukensis]